MLPVPSHLCTSGRKALQEQGNTFPAAPGRIFDTNRENYKACDSVHAGAHTHVPPRTEWHETNTKTTFKQLSHWSLIAEVFYIPEKVNSWAEVKQNKKPRYSCFHWVKRLWAGRAGAGWSHLVSARVGWVLSLVPDTSQLQVPTETRAHESHSTSSRKTGNASIPQVTKK